MVRPAVYVFFPSPHCRLHSRLTKQRLMEEAYTGMAAEHLPPLYSNTHPQILPRHQSIPRQGAGGAGSGGEDVLTAGGHMAPPGGTRGAGEEAEGTRGGREERPGLTLLR